MDGKILVEDEAGVMTDFTTVTWQIGLGETLCYRSVISHCDLTCSIVINHETGFDPRPP